MVLHEAPSLIPFPSSVRRGDGSVRLGSVRIERGSRRRAAAARLSSPLASAASSSRPTERPRSSSRSSPRSDPREGYALDAADGRVRITGHDAAGLFYGTRTLLQLLHRDDAAGWSVPEVRIDDAPRFAYRGVMLDVARHFFGVDDVRRFIDRAADLKFNHLHLHLSDDQGWRIQIDSWPLLAERGGASEMRAADPAASSRRTTTARSSPTPPPGT